ncbi:MAG: dTMP kinase [Anaerolineae bacterium]
MSAATRGMFITFEGAEGSGKSTQARQLAEWLQSQGASVLFTREPGGTPIADQIRHIILTPDNTAMVPQAEALLYSASRAQHVAERIRPALAAGQIVVCDRFADSTLAYQGYGLGLDLTMLRVVTQFATGGLSPDLTIYLDCPVEIGLARKRAAARIGGEWNRLDRKPIEYHERVRAGYLELARIESRRWLIIDATGPVESVQDAVRAAATPHLETLWQPPLHP